MPCTSCIPKRKHAQHAEDMANKWANLSSHNTPRPLPAPHRCHLGVHPKCKGNGRKQNNKTNRAHSLSLRNAPDPPRHAPRPPRHPQAQQGANLDHLTAAANHDAKAKEGGKCKSRGSLDNTRTHIRTGGGIGQPRTPRTLRTGNLGDFPQLYRPDDE